MFSGGRWDTAGVGSSVSRNGANFGSYSTGSQIRTPVVKTKKKNFGWGSGLKW